MTASFDPRTYWETKDGRIIPIKQLSDNHLKNIIKFLENKHAQEQDIILASPSLFEQTEGKWLSLLSRTIEDDYPIYKFLAEEVRSRGLQ